MSAHPLRRRTLRPRSVLAFAAAVCCAAALTVGCSSGPERDTATFCTAYVDVAERGVELADPDDVSIPTLRTQVRAITDSASDAAKRAPEAIADTVETVIGPLDTLRDGIDEAEDRAGVVAALRAYRAEAAKVTKAQEKLDTWVAANCGVVSVTTTTVPVTIDPN